MGQKKKKRDRVPERIQGMRLRNGADVACELQDLHFKTVEQSLRKTKESKNNLLKIS